MEYRNIPISIPIPKNRERKNMTTKQRIEDFIKHYRNLNPYWKNLLKSSYDYYKNQQMKYLIELSNHPYPYELESLNRTTNRSDIITTQRTYP